MSFKVRGHDVDLEITYDFVYMSFIETLVMACHGMHHFWDISPNITKIHIGLSNLENKL